MATPTLAGPCDVTAASQGVIPADMVGVNCWLDDFLLFNSWGSAAAAKTPSLLSAAGFTTLRMNLLGARYRWRGDNTANPNYNASFQPDGRGPQYAYVAGNAGPTTTGVPSVIPFPTVNNFMDLLATQMSPIPRITLICNMNSNAAGTDGNTTQDVSDLINYVNNGIIPAGSGLPTPGASWPKITRVELDNEVYASAANDAATRFGHHAAVPVGPYGVSAVAAPQSAHAYALRAIAFSQAIKTADPSIKVAVSLYTEDVSLPACPYTPADDASYGDGTGLGWNQSVLSGCGSAQFTINSTTYYAIDEVQVHDFPYFGAAATNDANLLACADRIPTKAAIIKGYITTYCGANPVKLAMTAGNSCGLASPIRSTIGPPNALYAAEMVMGWLQQGASVGGLWFTGHATIDMTALDGTGGTTLYYAPYSDFGMLSLGNSVHGVAEAPAQSPFPAYWGLTLLRYLGRPGDTMLSARHSLPGIRLYPVKPAGGGLDVLIVNRNAVPHVVGVNLAFSGVTLAGTGTLYTYGSQSGGGGIASSALTGASSRLTVTLPPHSMAVAALV